VASLVHQLVFPLGGDPLLGTLPWLVNLRPGPEGDNISLIRPISFSIRIVRSYTDPNHLFVVGTYAQIYGHGDKFFDYDLPRTVRHSLLDKLTNKEPVLNLIPNTPPDESIQIRKITNNPERTVYFTTINADNTRAYRNVLVSALIRPVTVTPSSPGTFSGPVLGIELGPRNQAVYAWFKTIGGVNSIVLTGPVVPSGVPTPQVVVQYDWSANQRYSLIWNEVRGIVQLFANNDILIVNHNISDFPQFPVGATKHVTDETYVAVYGLEGPAGDEMEISNVAITDDVQFPLITLNHPSAFTTTRRIADQVKTTPRVDPRFDQTSPWYEDRGTHFPAPLAGIDSMVMEGVDLKLTKKFDTSTDHNVAIYREEPGFLISNQEAMLVDLNFHATATSLDGVGTGMGFVICDFFTTFKVQCLFEGGVRYIGILRVGGTENVLEDHIKAQYDWTVPGTLRFVADGRKNKVRLYDHRDLVHPILDVPFVRTNFPACMDFGFDTFVPFIAIGHVNDLADTAGSMYIRSVSYSHWPQVWEAINTRTPDDGNESPQWDKVETGSPTLIPSSPLTGDFMETEVDGNSRLYYFRDAEFDAERGATVEARLSITSHDKLEDTGVAVILNDGLTEYVLTFSETEQGRFACLGLRANVDEFQAVPGLDGAGESVSFRVDWTEPHTYRLERDPLEGVFIFLDDELIPRIKFPEGRLNELPSADSSSYVLFGHFLNKHPARARWYFVRTFFSTGFEVSFKKDKPDIVLKEELFAKQAVVLVEYEEIETGPPPDVQDCTDIVFPPMPANQNLWTDGPNLTSSRGHTHAALTRAGGVLRALVGGGGFELAESFSDDTDVDAIDFDANTNAFVGNSFLGIKAPMFTLDSCDVISPKTGASPRYLAASGTLDDTGALASITDHRLSSGVKLQDGKILYVGKGTSFIDIVHENIGYNPAADLYDPVTGIWTAAAPPPYVFADGSAGALLLDGRAFFCGGQDFSGLPGNVPTVNAAAYDPNTNTWSTFVEDLNFGRSFHTATTLNDGKVLITGGYVANETHAHNSAELFDPSGGGTFEFLASHMGTAKARHAAVLQTDGTVLVIGGHYASPADGRDEITKKCDVYDPISKTFSFTGELSDERHSFAAILVPKAAGSTVYVMGGFLSVGETQALDSTEYRVVGSLPPPPDTAPDCSALVFPPIPANLNFWQAGPNLSSARGSIHGALTKVSGNVRALFGAGLNQGFGAGSPVQDIDAVNFDANTRASLGTSHLGEDTQMFTLDNCNVISPGLSNSPFYRSSDGTFQASNAVSEISKTREGSGVKLQNGKIFYIQVGHNNGTVEAPAYEKASEIYDPNTGVWTPTAQAPYVFADGTACALLNDGKVLVTGGWDPEGTSNPVAWAAVYDPGANSWAVMPDMIHTRYRHTATTLNNGKVLVTGGDEVFAPSPHSTETAELFDPGSNTWSATTNNMSSRRAYHAAVKQTDGTVLVASGKNGPSYVTPTCDIYDPGTGLFTPTGDMLTPRWDFAMILVPKMGGSTVYAAGGFADLAGSVPLNTTEYRVVGTGDCSSITFPPNDPDIGDWSAGQSLTSARGFNFMALTKVGGNLRAIFGAGRTEADDGLDITDVDLLDFNNGPDLGDGPIGIVTNIGSSELGLATPMFTMNDCDVVSARVSSSPKYEASNGTLTTTGGLIPLASGRDGSGVKLQNGKIFFVNPKAGPAPGAAIYDPGTGLWTATADPPFTFGTETACALLQDGKVLVTGGTNPAGPGAMNSTAIYDPGANSWNTNTQMITPRYGHTATTLQNGKVLVVGGFSDDNYTEKTWELYNPADDTWSLGWTEMFYGRAYHAAVLLTDGRVVIIAGLNRNVPEETEAVLSNCEYWNPDDGFLYFFNDTITARHSFAAMLVPRATGSVIWIGGGYTNIDGTTITDTTEFSIIYIPS
jgi:N-acetylneuraminic acid mutarotase